MKRLGLILVLSMITFFVGAQSARYQLKIEVKQFDHGSGPSFISLQAGNKKPSLYKIENRDLIITVDSLLTYPQPVLVYYYTNCTEEEVISLKKYGRAEKHHAELSFFMDDSVNRLQLRPDGIELTNPTPLQEKYFKLEAETEARIQNFSEQVEKPLFEEYQKAKSKREKDSIRGLVDNMFKVNVARINLDSSLMPAIDKNINNPLMFAAIKRYLYIARALDMEIPKEKLLTNLNSASQEQKNLSVWQELYDQIDAITDTKSLISANAPEFTGLKDLSGKKVQLEDFRGKIVFLDFWASWCAPCKQQMPQLRKISEQVKGEDVTFIGISLDVDADAWKKGIEESGLHWVHISDLKGLDGLTNIAYHVSLIPHNFLIDNHGIIIAENVPLDELAPAIQKLLKK